MRVGFIGLGSMGAPIARRLARSGFEVTGRFPGGTGDVRRARNASRYGPGHPRARRPDARPCVLNDAQVESVPGNGKVFDAKAEDAMVILNSTVSPDLARTLAERAKAKGVGLVAALLAAAEHILARLRRAADEQA